jgi:surface antigen
MHKLVSTVALCAALVACAEAGPQGGGELGTTGVSKTTGGAQLGASAGGLIVAPFRTSLGRDDQKALHDATANALENTLPNQAAPWRNPSSGDYGTVTPGPVQQVASGQYCREFQQTIIAGGREQQGHGRACRQADSSWKMVQ